MNTKAARHREILRQIRERSIPTQAELKEILGMRGFGVDQATLSRDIKELGLVKVAENGGYKYAPLEAVSPVIPTQGTGVIARLVKGYDHAGHLVILKTGAGNAAAVALAVDRLGWKEIAGTVAGDDTLFVAVRDGVSTKKVIHRLEELRR